MGHINLLISFQILDNLDFSLSILAYLDPGSGSFILQLIIAGFAGLIYALRGYWAKLISLLRRPRADERKNTTDTNDIEQ